MLILRVRLTLSLLMSLRSLVRRYATNYLWLDRKNPAQSAGFLIAVSNELVVIWSWHQDINQRQNDKHSEGVCLHLAIP